MAIPSTTRALQRAFLLSAARAIAQPRLPKPSARALPGPNPDARHRPARSHASAPRSAKSLNSRAVPIPRRIPPNLKRNPARLAEPRTTAPSDAAPSTLSHTHRRPNFPATTPAAALAPVPAQRRPRPPSRRQTMPKALDPPKAPPSTANSPRSNASRPTTNESTKTSTSQNSICATKIYQGAYLRAKDAVKTQPDYSAAHFALAEIAQKMKKKDEAIAEFQTYLKLDPDGEKAKEAHGIGPAK